MLLSIIKIPLYIVYLLAVGLMQTAVDKKQRRTYLLCAIFVGGLLSL